MNVNDNNVFYHISRRKEDTLANNITKLVTKACATMVKQIDKAVIDILVDYAEKNNVNELIAIDESKLIEMVKQANAWKLIREKFVDLALLKRCRDLITFNKQTYGKQLEQDEFDFLKEMTETE